MFRWLIYLFVITGLAAVQACNSGGSSSSSDSSTTTTISKKVPSISYSTDRFSFVLNDGASTTLAPVNSGGDITSCTVSPTLPTGLSINSSTCEISGTPTANKVQTNYTINPTNSFGSGTAHTLKIVIASGVATHPYQGITYIVRDETQHCSPRFFLW